MLRRFGFVTCLFAIACGPSSSDDGSETDATSMSGGEETTGYMGDPGEFVLLTYNVAGLPQGLSSSDP